MCPMLNSRSSKIIRSTKLRIIRRVQCFLSIGVLWSQENRNLKNASREKFPSPNRSISSRSLGCVPLIPNHPVAVYCGPTLRWSFHPQVYILPLRSSFEGTSWPGPATSPSHHRPHLSPSSMHRFRLKLGTGWFASPAQ
jgi:hypothetical protein